MSENQRQEIAEVIASRYDDKVGQGASIEFAECATDELLQLGYRKPRTITTVEELDAMPLESVVRSDIGVTYEKDADMDEPDLPWWVATGDSRMYPARRILLPATVLHEPEVTK